MTDNNKLDIHNPIIATLFILEGAFCSVIYLFIIILHFRNQKLRQDFYSLILATLSTELVIALNFLLNGIVHLLEPSESKNEHNSYSFFCQTNAFCMVSVYNILVSYNLLIMVCLILNLFKKYKSDSRIFFLIHSFSIIFGILMGLIFFIFDFLGANHSGFCNIKYKEDFNISFMVFLLVLCIIYCLISIVYLILDYKYNYSNCSSTLKNYSWYVVASIFFVVISLFYFKLTDYKSSDEESSNINEILMFIYLCLNLSGCLIITYYRISHKYIKIILSNGCSTDRMTQAILIFFCLEDVDDSFIDDRRLTATRYSMVM